jgi:putative ABC transport system ATP-binding protein
MKPDPIISVRDLSHAFGDGVLQKVVLHQVSVDFYPGEIVIITGPSGSGKTTFLTLVGAMRTVQSGRLEVLGQNLGARGADELMQVRRRMGFIFQSHNLIDALTASENIQMALIGDAGETPETAREKALTSLAEVGLRDHAHKKPRHLSGGQQQRVAIARALVRGPQIILADEPTAALDKQTGREIVELLHRLAKRTGCTILLVTHDNRILDVADRIIRIDDGCLEETRISIERVLAQVRKLLRVLSRYPSCWLNESAGGVLSDLHAEFVHTSGPLNRQVADLMHGQMPAGFAERAQALQELLHHTVSLEETVLAFGEERLQGASGADIKLAEQLTIGMEFLLTTAADTVDNPDHRDVAMLQQLTRDRGQMMDELRDSYLGAQGDVGNEHAAWLFTATQNFARQVYFLHHVATRYFSVLGQSSDDDGDGHAPPGA